MVAFTVRNIASAVEKNISVNLCQTEKFCLVCHLARQCQAGCGRGGVSCGTAAGPWERVGRPEYELSFRVAPPNACRFEFSGKIEGAVSCANNLKL